MRRSINQSRSRTRWFDTLLVVVAAATLFVAWYAMQRGSPWLAFLAIAACACIAYGVFVEPRLFVVRRYRIALAKDPKTWVRLIFLSDLHAGGTKKRSWHDRLALEVQAQAPDLLIFGGDLVVDFAKPVKDLASLAAVRAPMGRFFVLGNHDVLDDPALIRRTLREWGVIDITNGHLSFTKEGQPFAISGLDDHWHGRPDVPPIRSSKEIPHITIAHEPDGVLDFKEGDTDLILSGHTHGGQIRLPILGSIWKLPCTIGRRGDRGSRLSNGVRHLISAGLGETDMRARFLCRPEIVVVDIGI